MRVLVLDGNENQAVAAVRSLARAGHTVEVGASQSWSKASWSRYSHASFVYPSPEVDADGFVRAVAERAQKQQGTFVLPMTERTTLPLSTQRAELEAAGARFVFPAHDILLRAFDKRETTALARSLGLAVPVTLNLTSAEEALQASKTFPFPAVLKPRASQEADESGQTIHATGAPIYARDEAEFLTAYAELRHRCRDVLAQEWVAGQGSGYFALMHHGQLRAEFAHKRLRDVRPTGSGSALRESVRLDGPMREGALALLEALNWHGVAMVEFRLRADGTPVFLEVNGRFWNSLALAVNAGVDFPALLAEMAESGDVASPMPEYRTGVQCRWLLGDTRNLLEVLRGAPPSFPGKFPSRVSALNSFLAPHPGAFSDNFQWQDPLPEAGDWLDFALHRVPGLVKKGSSMTSPNKTAPESKRPLKGAMHLHSTYSDGEYTLAELRTLFLAAGCQFACVTDHAEAFDEAKLEAYRSECEELSDDKFRFVAGLEYACGRLHILGYGLTESIDTREPNDVIRRIRDKGGVCVVAHPQNRFFRTIEEFEPVPHGIEVWNSKYEGRYAPRPATFALLRKLQRRDAEVRAFYGLDLHWKKQFRGLFCQIECELSRDAILNALKNGDFQGWFTAKQGGFPLPSNGKLSNDVIAKLRKAMRVSRVIRRASRSAQGLGKAVPAPLKAQLRRIF